MGERGGGRAALFSIRFRKVSWLLRRPSRLALALRHRTVPTVEFADVVRRLAPRTVVDAGANVGQFSWAVRLAGSRSLVIVIEPIAESLDRARKLAESLGGPFQFHRLALSDRGDAVVRLFVPKDSDGSSLHRPTSSESCSHVQVPLARLDSIVSVDVLEPPVLLKIDVQGHELQLLEGAGPLLNVIDHVLVEVSLADLYEGQARASDVIAFLLGHGFALEEITSVLRTKRGKILEADLLFSRPHAGGR